MKKLFGLLTTLCAILSSTYVFAEGEQAGGTQGMLVSFLPFIILIVAFYFILIKPQKKKEKETRNMLNSLSVGDEIVTIGGVHGKIVKVKEDTVTIETGSDRVKIVFERGAVSRVTNKNEKAAKAEAKAEEKPVATSANEELAKEKEEMKKDKE